MVGRVSVCLALVLAAAVALDAVPVGSLQPAPPSAPATARFAQLHAHARARHGMRSEAPDWWHYVAPWWSPPDHAPTKEVPDFVEEPMYAHFKNPPKDTMAVYVPYGRDAMSSFVETDTRIAPTAAARRPLYAGLDTGYGPDPTGPLPGQAMQQLQYPSVAESAAMATQPRFAAMATDSAQAVPPFMPSFPGVPQLNDAAGSFALPSTLQMPMQYTPLMQQYMQPQQLQQQQQQQRRPMAPPPAGSPEAVQYALSQKAVESAEDARYAQLEDAEFGAHAKLAHAGAPVPRIWRTDRQSASDLAEERDFEADDVNANDEANMAHAAQGLDADDEEHESSDDSHMAFRQRLSATTDADSEAVAEAEAESDAQDKRSKADEREHQRRLEAAQKLRSMAAAQFSDEATADASAEDEEAEGHTVGTFAVDPYRFQQIGDELEAADDEELDEEDADEAEHDETEAEADAAEEAEAEEKNAADVEDEQSLFEARAGHGDESVETNAHGETEEVLDEVDDASEAADNADAALDTAAVDAALEREADAMEADYEHRAGLA